MPFSNQEAGRHVEERTLRESEERFRRLFEGAPVGMAIADAETRILRANEAFCRMLGYAESELLHRRSSDLTHPEDRGPTIAAVHAFMAGEAPTYRQEKRYLAKDGKTIWVDVSASMVRSDLGKPLYVVGVIQDISEQKQALEQLRASQERSRKLAALALEAREEERTRIARELHDELGQMLTGLKLGLEGLAAGCSGQLASRLAGMSEIVRTSIGSVQRICAELRPAVLDHFGLVAAIQWQAQAFESSTGIECAITGMPANLLLAPGQSTAVFRIFQEILTNVARHARASRTSVHLSAGPKWLTLSVRDNGVGLNKDKPGDPRSLGLLGMRERASLLGGSIQFKSVRGTGTNVTLRLPVGQTIVVRGLP